MMKSPTSLIRIRYAVGVMLALSAIFAVVISSVTFTQDRALGQGTSDTTVSIVCPRRTCCLKMTKGIGYRYGQFQCPCRRCCTLPTKIIPSDGGSGWRHSQSQYRYAARLRRFNNK